MSPSPTLVNRLRRGGLDKFLAHLDQDDSQEGVEVLKQQVGKAKLRGLRDLHVVACVLNIESFRETA